MDRFLLDCSNHWIVIVDERDCMLQLAGVATAKAYAAVIRNVWLAVVYALRITLRASFEYWISPHVRHLLLASSTSKVYAILELQVPFSRAAINATSVCAEHGMSLATLPNEDTANTVRLIRPVFPGLVSFADAVHYSWNTTDAFCDFGPSLPFESRPLMCLAYSPVTGEWVRSKCEDPRSILCESGSPTGIHIITKAKSDSDLHFFSESRALQFSGNETASPIFDAVALRRLSGGASNDSVVYGATVQLARVAL